MGLLIDKPTVFFCRILTVIVVDGYVNNCTVETNHDLSLFCLRGSESQPSRATGFDGCTVAEHSKIKTNFHAHNFTNGSFLFTTANILKTTLFATAFSTLNLCFPSLIFRL